MKPAEGVVSWNINTACNYRCSYCTQRFASDRTRWSRDTPRFLEAFARLPGPWEVKLSGGEPFVHPTLVELVEGLAGQGRAVSVVTNLSASIPKLERFLAAAGARLRVFSCSLHLEYVEADQFLAKVAWLQSRAPQADVNVTCVATRANLPRVGSLEAQFADAGVRFKVQPEKQDGEVIAYSPQEQATLMRLGGHNRTGLLAPNFQGRPCWAGSRYFILDDQGRAWRCYPARRQRTEYLGDFLDPAFRLYAGSAPCRYTYCNCTVPIQRRMMAP